ncbi:hypothetical protein B0H66DRAFT_494356 [Apodospora peruviana]|uniref:FAD-binding PCMH-type domain-containing protein n=1 Tax=Apodospora peruviana TaxID=516989 RepID=A0AAE0IAZ8_9PEZI|nr:hypothetical protein B0H66DRAFT_494356 [Apodospora peruviana]
MFISLLKVATAASFLQTSLAASILAERNDTQVLRVAQKDQSLRYLDWSDVASLQPARIDGKKYGCKCYPGDSCWPKAQTWNQLNRTVDGKLLVHVPPGAPCHSTFAGPFGTVRTYDAAACQTATDNWGNETWTVEQPAAALWTYFTNDTCVPTADRSQPCTLGYYGVYVIMATKRSHVKAGIDFARRNNIRLIVRNTGHDFIGRSTGFGSLVINTHSFKSVEWIDSYRGPGSSYRGSAVKIGAGVQGRELLSLGHARKTPTMLVTGECPTVGIAGGFIQGGGHGPWSTLKGMSADNVLAFEVITASGQYVNANDKENPDLFWALKGGGPASFAVILSVTMKTFPDLPSAGATLYINGTHGVTPDQWWNATSSFHKYSNHFVDQGLYVYYELMPMTFRVRPFVAIGKTTTELRAILAPFLAELDALNVAYEFDIKGFSTFYDLYIDLFEDETSGQTALTGGWLFTHSDVAERNDDIINAFKTALSPRPDVFALMIGHLFNPGHGMPVSNSATHPAWRNATDYIITVVPLFPGAPPAVKADFQNVLTHTIDDALRSASTSGAAYVNEADPYQPNWQGHFWGSEYPKLKQYRSKWDPKGIFYAISTPGTEAWEVVEGGTRLCKKL